LRDGAQHFPGLFRVVGSCGPTIHITGLIHLQHMQLAGTTLHTLLHAEAEATGHGLVLECQPVGFHGAGPGIDPSDLDVGCGEKTAHLGPYLPRRDANESPALITQFLDANHLAPGPGHQWGRPRYFELPGK